MKEKYLTRCVIYFILLVVINFISFGFAIVLNISPGFHPSVIGIIIFPLFYSLFAYSLYHFFNERPVSMAIVWIPTISYLLFITMNAFAAWELIEILNQHLNYFLYLLSYFTTQKIATPYLNSTLVLIVLPILYHYTIFSISKKLEKKIDTNNSKPENAKIQ